MAQFTGTMRCVPCCPSTGEMVVGLSQVMMLVSVGAPPLDWHVCPGCSVKRLPKAGLYSQARLGA